MALSFQDKIRPVETPQIGGKLSFLRNTQPAPETFSEEKPKSFLGKAGNFLTGFFGGKELAQGAGQAIAAKDVQKELGTAQDIATKTQSEIIKRIREKKAKGEDTSRLMELLKQSQRGVSNIGQTQQNFAQSLKTGKEVAGSALQLATTVAGGKAAQGAGKLFGAGKATSFLGGAARGAGAGVASGAPLGALYGASTGLRENKDISGITKEAATGAAIGGATGGVLGGIFGGVSGKLRGNKLFKAEQQRLLQENPDATVSKYMLDGKGKVVKDPIAREAIKQGLPEGTTSVVKGSSPLDKQKMNTMLDVLEKGQRDPRFAATNRPSDVIGDSVLDRFKVVQNANSKAASQLDDVARSLQGKKADPTPVVRDFIQKLDDLGVTFKNGKPQYANSQIEGLTEPQKIIDRIVKRMNNVSDDAYEIHKLKKFIDEQVAYGKTTGGLTGKTVNAIKSLRRGLDQTLDTTFTEYNRVNTVYSNTRDAIDRFISSAGAKFDPNSPNANARIGTLMRRILSNAQSRAEILNSLQQLQDTAIQQGGKFSDDVITQTIFVNDLERLFGTQAPTSLAGEVSKGVQRAGTFAGKLKSSEGIFDLALQATGEGIEKARGITQEGLMKSLRALLK